MSPRLAAAAALLLLSCGRDVDRTDPVGPRAGDDLWALVSADSDGLSGAFYTAHSGSVGGSMVSCETVDGCVVEPLGSKVCVRRGSFGLGAMRAHGAFGDEPLRADWPGTTGGLVPDGADVTFTHAGSATIPPFDVTVTMPRSVDLVLGACPVHQGGRCTIDPGRPVELATAAALGDTALSLVVSGTPSSPHVECRWLDGQSFGRVPSSVLSRLHRGATLSAKVSVTRVARAPVLAHWVEARASRSWSFALTLAP